MSGSSAGGSGPKRGKRRRTVLNLGMPFVQVDDFVDQAEEAISVGYRVLEDVVEEVKAGYQIAKDYNAARRRFEKEEIDPATQAKQEEPEIPWEKMVDRLQSMQGITFDAMKNTTDILLESAKSGMKSAHSVADTLAKSRKDADQKVPKLAGPVFADVIVVQATAGAAPPIQEFEMRHAGLARLRIAAQVAKLRELIPSGEAHASLTVRGVSFGPATPAKQDVSVLTIDVGYVLDEQKPGSYEGLITASNFELLIARLRVEVAPGEVGKATPKEAPKETPRGAAKETPKETAKDTPRGASKPPPKDSSAV